MTLLSLISIIFCFDLVSHHDRRFFVVSRMASTASSVHEKEEGNTRFRNGDYLGAIACYSRALEGVGADDSLRATLHCNRALCYIYQRDWRNAVSDSSQTLKVDPNNEKALFRSAQAHLGWAGYDIAAPTPASSVAITSLKSLEAELEHLQLALSSLSTLLRTRPSNTAAVKLAQQVRVLEVRCRETLSSPTAHVQLV
jgi:tetratricopeptide (TPR) repeat protein